MHPGAIKLLKKKKGKDFEIPRKILNIPGIIAGICGK